MAEGELKELERRAAENHGPSLTALGRLALVGRAGGRSVEEGFGMLAAAAEGGDAEADATIAVLVGIDAQSISDWDRAFDYLGRAAARGFAPARAQLALYCPDPQLVAASKTASPPPSIWRQMKEAIDIAALLRTPQPKVMRDPPYIAVFEGFATRLECEWMMASAKPRLARAKIFDQRGRVSGDASARTNSAMQYDILNADFVLIVLQAKIAAASGFAVRCLEEANVLHYAPGQAFTTHYDFFAPENPEFKQELADRGQRAVTFLIYLNDEFEGGETSFESLGWRYKGRPGDALLFRNVTPSGAPDPQSLHAGLAPTAGEKWVLSQWIRSHPPRRPEPPGTRTAL